MVHSSFPCYALLLRFTQECYMHESQHLWDECPLAVCESEFCPHDTSSCTWEGSLNEKLSGLAFQHVWGRVGCVLMALIDVDMRSPSSKIGSSNAWFGVLDSIRLKEAAEQHT